jgi:hypothetical protein
MKYLESFNSIKTDVENILNIARDEGFFVSLKTDDYNDNFSHCIVIGADANMIANPIDPDQDQEFYEICKNVYSRLQSITDASAFLVTYRQCFRRSSGELLDSEDGYYEHGNLNHFKPNGNYHRIHFGRVSINL